MSCPCGVTTTSRSAPPSPEIGSAAARLPRIARLIANGAASTTAKRTRYAYRTRPPIHRTPPAAKGHQVETRRIKQPEAAQVFLDFAAVQDYEYFTVHTRATFLHSTRF